MDDDQAFPAAWGNPQQGGDYVPGMTLRDWFAGQALAGLCTNCTGSDIDVSWFNQHGAKGAYAIADAMLKARFGQ